jgi:hypothetical protein
MSTYILFGYFLTVFFLLFALFEELKIFLIIGDKNEGVRNITIFIK